MSKRREQVLLASLVLVEASWIYLVLTVLGLGLGDGPPLLTWPVVAGLLVFGVAFQAWIVAQPLPEGAARAVGTAAGLLMIYVVISLQYGDPGWLLKLGRIFSGNVDVFRITVSTLAALALWWVGLNLAASREYVVRLRRTFPVALAAIVAGAILEATTSLDLRVGVVGFVILTSALVGFALANMRRPEVHGASFARLLIGVGASVLLIGVLVGLLADTPFASALGAVVGAFGVVAELILRIVFIPIQWALQGLFAILNFILQWLTGGEGLQWPELNTLERGVGEEDPTVERGSGLVWLLTVLKWTIAGLVVAAVLAFLYWVLWVGRRFDSEQEDESRESVREEFDAEQWSVLGSLFGRGTRGEGPQPYPLPTGDDPASRVRRAYLRLLNLALERGKPRQPWETPLEFQPELAAEFPGTPVGDVTAAFLRVRFGLLPPSTEEVTAVEHAVGRAPEDRPRPVQEGPAEEGAAPSE